ncbi:MAG: hypothetical protein GC161_18650 [Planctomycetaceae bacterium]|nr:hypothetical protein [Planctomycetaceae bacterium]
MNVALWTAPIFLAGAAMCALGLYESARPGLALLLLFAALGVPTIGAMAANRSCGIRSARLDGWVAGAACIALTMPIVVHGAALFGRLDFMAPVAWVALRAFGVDVELEGGVLYAHGNGLESLTVDLAKLGLVPAAWILLATATGVLASKMRRPSSFLAKTAVWTAAYLPVRLALLSAFTVRQPGPTLDDGSATFVVSVYLSQPWQTITFLPLALVLGRFVPWPDPPDPTRAPARPGPMAALACVSALFLGLFGYLAVQLEPPGSLASGRVLVDELHGAGWSSAVAPLDAENFGRDSVYTLTAAVRLLGESHEVRVNTEHRYTDELLDDVDVLVIEAPTVPFDTAEVDAIERFVRDGGGLYLVGDHTDLLGTSTNLNAVASRFGVRFVQDACNRLEDGQTHSWTPLPWSTHPITRDIDELEFLTSCTLELSGKAEPLIIARNAFAEPLDYAGFSFFADTAPDLDDDLGPQVVAAVLRPGAGRVALFADSTLFSSFALPMPGRAELLSGTVAWLAASGAGTDRLAETARLTAGVFALLLTVAGLRVGRRLLVPVPLLLLLGVVAGTGIAERIDRERSPLPAFDGFEAPSLTFVREGCDFELPPPVLPDRAPAERSYSALFHWNQRLGGLPRLKGGLAETTDENLVLVRPEPNWLAEHELELSNHVQEGGRLLLLLEPANLPAAWRDALEASPSPADGAAAGRVARFGAGRLGWVADPDSCSDLALGNLFDPLLPDDPRRHANERVKTLLEAWLAPEPSARGGL